MYACDPTSSPGRFSLKRPGDEVARDRVEVHPQKKKEVLCLVKTKKKRKQEQLNIIMDINCEVLLQEFNKFKKW